MRKTTEYNNVSQELLSSTKLKKGETVTYRTTYISRNPVDPSELLIPSSVTIPSTDQIWDEHSQDYVDIAAISSVSANGEPQFYEISFTKAQAGHIILHGGIAADQDIHSYLMLCNYNKSNANRDTTKSVYFELVDEGRKSEEERKHRNLKREALNAAADLSIDDVKNYIAALGRDDNRDIQVLRNELEDMADKAPAMFIELINNKQATMKAIINRALSKKVIMFNEEQSRFVWPNNEAILTVSRTTGSDAVDELISFCVSSAKGEKVFQTIQSKSKK